MDWNKIGSLGTLGCLAVAIAALVVETTKPDVKTWVWLLLLCIAALGLAAVFVVSVWKKYRALRTLPFRILFADCNMLLSEYRRLAFDHPDTARLPLHPSSYPE